MTDGSMALTFFPTFVVDFDGKLVGLHIPVPMDPWILFFDDVFGGPLTGTEETTFGGVWNSYPME